MWDLIVSVPDHCLSFFCAGFVSSSIVVISLGDERELMSVLFVCPHLIRLTTKPTKWHVRPAKIQISLGIRPVRSKSSLCAQWVAKGPSFVHADSEDSDQTGRMPRLI